MTGGRQHNKYHAIYRRAVETELNERCRTLRNAEAAHLGRDLIATFTRFESIDWIYLELSTKGSYYQLRPIMGIDPRHLHMNNILYKWRASGDPWRASGDPWRASGDPWRASGNPWRLLGETTELAKQTIKDVVMCILLRIEV